MAVSWFRVHYVPFVTVHSVRAVKFFSYVSVTFVLVLVAWFVLLGPGATPSTVPVPAPGSPADRPPVPENLSATPLGAPGPVPDEPGTVRFTAFQDDGLTPVAYDPCRQIHYVVSNEASAPDPAVVAEAFAEVSYRTGLQFVYDGPTTELPSPDRSDYQPEMYGERWAPVLVAWSDPAGYPELDGATTGLAGSTSISTSEPGSGRYVTGQAVFDTPQLTDMSAAEVRAVVMHEFGHLVGLDHVSDQNELMYSDLLPGNYQFGPGDLAGLARLGQGTCFTDL